MKKLVSLILVLSFIFIPSGFIFPGSKAKVKKPSSAYVKKVNINTAGVKELQTLPRVGEKTAKRIIDYRKKHGRFKRIEDIMKVKGIGEKTFQKMKNRITVR